MPLNYFIRPMSPDMQARTLLAHTVRGIAFMLTSPASLPISRHRLDLPFVLGLGSHVRWYPEHNKRNAARYYVPSRAINATLLGLASGHWQRSLQEFDGNAVDLALRALSPAQGDMMGMLVERDLTERGPSHFYLTERAELMKLSETIPKDVMDKLEMALAGLTGALLAKDPLMPNHLRATHTLLVSYPETVHLLDDNEVAAIIEAAQVHTQTQIVKATVGKSATSRKKISADEL